MSIEQSARVQRIQPSATIAVTRKANQLRAAGEDIIGLGAGEPDFDTPEHIKDAARAAIAVGATKYTSVDGTDDIKRAIIGKFSRDNDVQYDPDEILVSCGAKHSLFNLMQALIDGGDEVIVPSPCWVSYPDMALLVDGTPVVVPTTPEQRFKIEPDQLRAAITERTRLLVLNSPSNPTGMAYTAEEYRALGAVLADHPRVMIVSDEIYEHIYWGESAYCSWLQANPQLRDRTVLVNGVSKAYAMTGWRIGYAAGPADLIAAMRKVQGQSTSNACSISQAATVAALEGDQQIVREMSNAFRKRHDYVTEALRELPGVQCLAADGAFYAFPGFQGAIDVLPGIDDDVALAEWFLSESRVALVPGSAFHAPGHLRLSYASSMDTLERAIERMDKALRLAT